jgi:hypothetical protein
MIPHGPHREGFHWPGQLMTGQQEDLVWRNASERAVSAKIKCVEDEK